MTDASGATTYGYDANNRLQSKATPEGTLSYTYDEVGDVTNVSSNHSSGVNTRYGYDALNRMSVVTALSDFGPIGNIVSNYTYDSVGNLATVAYPNGVTHTYTYNTLNRLTNLNVSCGTTAPGCVSNSAIYAYTLGPAGNRTGVTELGGRHVTYGYDDLYRLTSETITGAPSQNGTIGYVYDAVGNRQSLTSTVPAIPAGTLFYDANDRLSTDSYDNSGNTVNSGGIGNVYDFENHLVQHGLISIVYDGDGNRVSKTAGGVTTQYLVDTNSVTGYAQVLQELQGSSMSRNYTYGLSLISENQLIGSTQTVSFYGFDGHGNVRQITDRNGAVTDTYTYDAFGNLLTTTGSTPNNFKFAGEQFDPDLGLYYNRARYLDVRSGRFWGMDSFEGDPSSPESLHKYLYTGANPIDNGDPTGHEEISLGATNVAIGIAASLGALTAIAVLGQQILQTVRIGALQADGRLAQDGAQFLVSQALIKLSSGDVTDFVTYFGPSTGSARIAVTREYNEIAEYLTHTINYNRADAANYPSVYAYVYPRGNNTPDNIWLGALFFAAPFEGFDSRPGTIVHEVSHLVHAGIDRRYGRPNAIALARISPQLAQTNADSLEYYAEEAGSSPAGFP